MGDGTVGDWIWFNPDLWTTGFFPATLYAMHTRAQLCPSVGNEEEWLTLGRSWSTPEIPLELHNSVEHDVGFLSYPFMDELEVLVLDSKCMPSRFRCVAADTIRFLCSKIKQRQIQKFKNMSMRVTEFLGRYVLNSLRVLAFNCLLSRVKSPRHRGSGPSGFCRISSIGMTATAAGTSPPGSSRTCSSRKCERPSR